MAGVRISEEIAAEMGKSMAAAMRAMEKAGVHLALKSGMRDLGKSPVHSRLVKGFAEDYARYQRMPHLIPVHTIVTAAFRADRRMDFPVVLVAANMRTAPHGAIAENFAQAQRRFKEEPWTGYEPPA